jgi:hypothetical protein
VICDPTVIANGDRVTVWFGGGDVASPDQNLDGQIGLGALSAQSPPTPDHDQRERSQANPARPKEAH